ncbi:hemerythrin domain-containing protein [Undibacterium sp. FT147W]|uniref:Hemerythrin domain-containing protein n=1 Tax=Undibacterium rivi TaxID=2828729 RepID=A0ABS5H5X5_9BURK|nr:hemerythrin domain-containing protein [Undibacterium rivi]MBR7793509.1 hemerythrin domain-containing protein [Undibacterium rivi]
MTQNTWGWSDRLSLSYAPMDDIHHEFVELCAALSENNPDTFIQRLDALIAHSIEHFEQENCWMEETAFPPAGCHRQEHEAVLEVMREVRRRVEEEGDTELAARLAEELPHWFEHHVDTMDNMLARFMANLTADASSADVQEKAPA